MATTLEGFIVCEIDTEGMTTRYWILRSAMDAAIVRAQLVGQFKEYQYVIRRANVLEYDRR